MTAPNPAPPHTLFLRCDVGAASEGGQEGGTACSGLLQGQVPEVTSQPSHLLPVARTGLLTSSDLCSPVKRSSTRVPASWVGGDYTSPREGLRECSGHRKPRNPQPALAVLVCPHAGSCSVSACCRGLGPGSAQRSASAPMALCGSRTAATGLSVSQPESFLFPALPDRCRVPTPPMRIYSTLNARPSSGICVHSHRTWSPTLPSGHACWRGQAVSRSLSRAGCRGVDRGLLGRKVGEGLSG